MAGVRWITENLFVLLSPWDSVMFSREGRRQSIICCADLMTPCRAFLSFTGGGGGVVVSGAGRGRAGWGGVGFVAVVCVQCEQEGT